jgi:hypothetical protein
MSILSFVGFKKLKTPNRKIWIILLGLSAAILSNIAYVGDLFLEMYRESYPHWADSLAIPLMGVPVLIFVSLLWVGLNLIGLLGNFTLNVPLFTFNAYKSDYYYIAISSITLLLLIFAIVTGYFWQVIPGLLWVYFYLAILLGRRETRIEAEKKLKLIE